MSSIPTNLKSPSDQNIFFNTRKETIALAVITHDTLIEFNRLIKSFKIINNDGAANITFRTQSPSNTLETVPPNSEVTVDEWTSFLQLTPDPVTGAGLLEMDLVRPEEAINQQSQINPMRMP